MISVLLALFIINTVFFITGLILAIRVYVKLEAFEKSTHQIQYVPLEEDMEKAIGQKPELDALEKLYKDEDNDDFSESKF